MAAAAAWGTAGVVAVAVAVGSVDEERSVAMSGTGVRMEEGTAVARVMGYWEMAESERVAWVGVSETPREVALGEEMEVGAAGAAGASAEGKEAETDLVRVAAGTAGVAAGNN